MVESVDFAESAKAAEARKRTQKAAQAQNAGKKPLFQRIKEARSRLRGVNAPTEGRPNLNNNEPGRGGGGLRGVGGASNAGASGSKALVPTQAAGKPGLFKRGLGFARATPGVLAKAPLYAGTATGAVDAVAESSTDPSNISARGEGLRSAVASIEDPIRKFANENPVGRALSLPARINSDALRMATGVDTGNIRAADIQGNALGSARTVGGNTLRDIGENVGDIAKVFGFNDAGQVIETAGRKAGEFVRGDEGQSFIRGEQATGTDNQQTPIGSTPESEAPFNGGNLKEGQGFIKDSAGATIARFNSPPKNKSEAATQRDISAGLKEAAKPRVGRIKNIKGGDPRLALAGLAIQAGVVGAENKRAGNAAVRAADQAKETSAQRSKDLSDRLAIIRSQIAVSTENRALRAEAGETGSSAEEQKARTELSRTIKAVTDTDSDGSPTPAARLEQGALLGRLNSGEPVNEADKVAATVSIFNEIENANGFDTGLSDLINPAGSERGLIDAVFGADVNPQNTQNLDNLDIEQNSFGGTPDIVFRRQNEQGNFESIPLVNVDNISSDSLQMLQAMIAKREQAQTGQQ